MSRKKLIISISLISSVILMSVVAIIAILAATTQQVNSLIKVKYKATEVSLKASANYYLLNANSVSVDDAYNPLANGYPMYEYVNGNITNNTVISLNPNVTDLKYLAPEDIMLDGIRQTVVFEYVFENQSNSVNALIALSEETNIEDASSNIAIKYYASLTRLTDYTKITNNEYSPRTLMKGEGNKMYVYISASIERLSDDAFLQGDIGWTLSQATEGSVTMSENGVCTNSTASEITDLKIYGNSVQNGTPTPDAPVEIQSIGEKTKNLLNFDELLTNWGCLFEKSDNVYAITWKTACYSTPQKLDLESGKTYTFSITPNELNTRTNVCYSILTYTDNVFTTKFSIYACDNEQITKTITTEDTEYYIRLDYSSGTGTTLYYTEPQIEEGNTATAYEPYGYKVGITSRGKNLFNPATDTRFTLQDDGSYLSNTKIGVYNFIENLKGVYTISASVKCPVGKNYRFTVNYTDGTKLDSHTLSTGDYVDISLTTNGKDIAGIWWNYAASTTELQFKNLQLEKGATKTEYEPYVEPVTTYIYLDQPLRKVGDYADYIDYANKKVVRVVRNLVLSISNMNASEDYPGWRDTANLSTDYLGFNNYLSAVTNFICNISTDNMAFGINTKNGNSILWLRKEYFNLTQTEWITNYTNLTIVIDYVLSTPIEQSIDIPTISTLNGTTIIEVEGSIGASNITVEYGIGG